VDELRRAKEQGAIGVATLGTIGPRMLHEPEFDPVWAEAERLDLPVGVHTGWPHPGLNASCDTMWAAHVISFTMPVMMGFFAVIGGGVLDRHPGLRVGFFEAGADWLPFVLQRMEHYYGGDGAPGMGRVSQHRPRTYLERGQVYFTCEGDEALLPQVLTFLGDDHMMASGDVPHAEARDNCMDEIAERQDITEAQKRKILGENARHFYKLP
jgi:predicted TIM-barrel fold metal-dependent hydrolase